MQSSSPESETKKQPTKEEFDQLLRSYMLPDGAENLQYSDDGRHLDFEVPSGFKLRVYRLVSHDVKVNRGEYGPIPEPTIWDYYTAQYHHDFCAEFSGPSEESFKLYSRNLSDLMVKVGVLIQSLYRREYEPSSGCGYPG